MRQAPEQRSRGFRTLPAGPASRERALPGAARAHHPEPDRELAEILADELVPGTVVAGMTPTGLALARRVAARLALPLSPAPVVSLSPPWNAQPVYGAVAFDGSVHLDDDLLSDLEIGRRDLERAVACAREALGGDGLRETLELARRHAAVIDDGHAPAVVVAATVAALRNAGADRVIVAVSSGSPRHLGRLARDADRVLCARDDRTT